MENIKVINALILDDGHIEKLVDNDLGYYFNVEEEDKMFIPHDTLLYFDVGKPGKPSIRLENKSKPISALSIRCEKGRRESRQEKAYKHQDEAWYRQQKWNAFINRCIEDREQRKEKIKKGIPRMSYDECMDRLFNPTPPKNEDDE